MTSALVAFVVASTLRWLVTPRGGTGLPVEVTVPPGSDRERLAGALSAAGVVEDGVRLRALLLVASWFVTPEPGPHLLGDDLSPVEVLRRLARLASRGPARLVVPEGATMFQIADRAAAEQIATREAFLVAARDPVLLGRLGVAEGSAEGYLFPATYPFGKDTPAARIVEVLVTESRRRLDRVLARHPGRLARLEDELGIGERQLVNLASMVERETGNPEERPLVASVFLNRLRSETFRPARMLQSDPTAAYGCLLRPELVSCVEAGGRVTPALLRDPLNPYNTYRHAGLPPGPVGNPGEAALEAVLAAPVTDYLFFVATGGKTRFTRSLAEHEAALGGR
ncbi:MAG: endolytic transglycosylase MltG [Deltaproteobacteria bacterium]|nr:endolytic transglycosylase MltG [Deltaproteobacteria bacterium]